MRTRTRAVAPGRALEACLWMSGGDGQGQRVGQWVQTVSVVVAVPCSAGRRARGWGNSPSAEVAVQAVA